MFTPEQLTGYLDRVGHSGPVAPDLDTLRALHRAHLAAIPYENVNIQLGRPISLATDDLYAKLVTAGRGGFCYEMNGVLSHALRAIGFDVTILEGAVHREIEGDKQWMNHMPLLVDLPEGRYVADTGLGDGFTEPVPLEEGEHRQGRFTHRMTRIEEDVWRCVPDQYGSVKSFDLRIAPRKIPDFAEACHWRATSPESSFKKNLVVGQPRAAHMVVLRGLTLSFAGPDEPEGKRSHVIADVAEFARTLAEQFGLVLDTEEIDLLWTNSCQQHEAWLARSADAVADAAPAG